MDARRPIGTLVCLAALGAAVGAVELVAARQEAIGRAGLTRAAQRFVLALEGETGENPLRYLAPEDRYSPGAVEAVRDLAAGVRATGDVLVTRVETGRGGRSGVTELVLTRGLRSGGQVGRSLRIAWTRDGGAWTLDLEPR